MEELICLLIHNYCTENKLDIDKFSPKGTNTNENVTYDLGKMPHLLARILYAFLKKHRIKMKEDSKRGKVG